LGNAETLDKGISDRSTATRVVMWSSREKLWHYPIIHTINKEHQHGKNINNTSLIYQNHDSYIPFKRRGSFGISRGQSERVPGIINNCNNEFNNNQFTV
jgi:hypothetical protein